MRPSKVPEQEVRVAWVPVFKASPQPQAPAPSGDVIVWRWVWDAFKKVKYFCHNATVGCEAAKAAEEAARQAFILVYILGGI